MARDFYDVLGVSKTSDEKELKKAYRQLAKELHPDNNHGLPKEEIDARTARMQEVNIAYGVLSKPQERIKYDRLGRVAYEGATQASNPPKEGNSRQRRSQRRTSGTAGIFGEFFKGKGIFDFEGFRAPKPKPIRDLYIPENDLGLLSGLIKAYEAKNKGESDCEWHVMVAKSEERTWMPKELYRVDLKDDGSVSVSRKLEDWVNDGILYTHGSPIEMMDKDQVWKRTKVPSDTWFGEYYLYGKGKERFFHATGLPSSLSFGPYIKAMKSLAQIFADGPDKEGKYYIPYEVSKAINAYGEWSVPNSRVEGKGGWQEDEKREWVKKIPIEKLYRQIKNSEGLVRKVEGQMSGKEGNEYSGSPEG